MSLKHIKRYYLYRYYLMSLLRNNPRYNARKIKKIRNYMPVRVLQPRPPQYRLRNVGRTGRVYNKLYRRYTGGQDTLKYPGIGIPSEFQTKLKYSEVISLTAGIGTSYKQMEYRANSLFDCNYSGGGLNQQPSFYDQLCSNTSLYKRYVVTGCKIKIRACSQSDAFAAGNCDIAVTPSEVPYASTAWSGIDDQLAMKTSKSTAVTRYDNAGVKYLTHYATTKDVLDIKDMRDNLDTVGAYYNANPTNVWYWIIGMQGMDRSSTSASVNLLVNLTFYVTLYTENLVAES